MLIAREGARGQRRQRRQRGQHGQRGASAGSGAAGGGGSCGGAVGSGGSEPHFKLASATLRSATEISLVFSEAVADPSAVDPNAFHLSAGVSFKAGTSVVSPSGVSDYTFVQFCAGYGVYLSSECPTCSYAITLHREHTVYYGVDYIAGLSPGDRPEEIIATLVEPITAAPVFNPRRRGPSGPCGDLFLHYTEPASTGVESVGGAVLGSVGQNFGDCVAKLCIFPGHAVPVARDILDDYCSRAPRCSDGILEGHETDIDCGGLSTTAVILADGGCLRRAAWRKRESGEAGGRFAALGRCRVPRHPGDASRGAARQAPSAAKSHRPRRSHVASQLAPIDSIRQRPQQ